MSAIASIIHADGCRITSANRTTFVVLLPELPCLFFLTTQQQWITPREGALVDDLELLSFDAFGLLLLIRFLSAFRVISMDVLHLSVQVSKCSMTQSGIVMELGLRWL